MTRQLDLLGHAGLELEPEAGRSEPRLWVRRFVIWSEPGVMLREIHLRPGLNIIWAPDPADRVAVSDGDDHCRSRQRQDNVLPPASVLSRRRSFRPPPNSALESPGLSRKDGSVRR